MTRPLAYEPRHALNAICPYFTMFPLEYPLKALAKHRSDAPVVMDPFCGRGTTLYAARILGLASRGIDSSPVAVAIAQAKLCAGTTEGALKLADQYIEAHGDVSTPSSEFFRWAFHPHTLKSICAIRHGLLTESSTADDVVLLRAAMLGCLHGPQSKRVERSGYFSNQMPRTFASKPRYSVEYWKARNMAPRKENVLEVLRRKLARIQAPEQVEGNRSSDARRGDSRYAASLPASMRDFSVVITSPPYYGMKTYVEDQWLRDWFLGGPQEPAYGQATQLSHAGQMAFIESLGQVWKNMSRTRAQSLDMYVRFGVIPSAKADPKSLVMRSLEASGTKWRLVSTRSANSASSGKRQAAQMAADSLAVVEIDVHVALA